MMINELLTLNFPANAVVSIAGTPNAEELLGSVQTENFLSGGGDDLAIGYGGADWVAGNEGSDTLFGNEGTDVLQGGRDADFLFGGLSNDLVFGDLGNDFLSGDAGADSLMGGEGEDRFLLGTGGSTLADADVILDYSSGEDWLELNNGRTFASLEIQPGTGANAYDTIVQDKVTGEYLAVLKNFVPSGVLEFADESLTRLRLEQMPETSPLEPEIDEVADSPDPVTEAPESPDDGGGDDIDPPETDNDTLDGGEGNDTLYGEGGDDYLFGGDGNDYLDGGDGDDYLYGGDGNDRFVFDSNDDEDRILDFTSGQDLLVFESNGVGSNNVNFEDLLIRQEAGNTEIRIDDTLVILENFTGTLTESDFDFD